MPPRETHPTPDLLSGRIHGTVLRASAVWMILCGFLLSIFAFTHFLRAYETAERHVRIVRESGVKRIRHEGAIYSQDEIVRILKRRPYLQAAPWLALALLMGGCAVAAFRFPIGATAAALGTLVAAAGVRSLFPDPWSSREITLFLALGLLLLLGLRASREYTRWRAAVIKESPAAR